MSNKKTGVAALAFAALGVVYGDIGTSPLYALNEIFFGHEGKHRPTDILGVISVVVWALILIIAVKYVLFVLRADNDGEGGVFSLVALLKKHRFRSTTIMAILLTFGAGLLFGDGIITPAISVLSAVEGLKVAAPSLSSFIVPITIVILISLFSIQKHGTSVIGKLFGPVIFIWFVTIAVLGARQVLGNPDILQALNPIHAVNFIRETRPYALLFTLGSVMLVVTGGEALYADMGHFGRTPIRLSWFSVVMPSLILSYLGQGAYLLSGKQLIENNIFFSTVPREILYPIVVLAAAATVIASQALISGAFSLTSQGISLGLMPRLRIKHTHAHHEGQIYVPFINWALLLGCLMLVIFFKTSGNLASAYGLAVSIDMFITSLAIMFLAKLDWGWKKSIAILVFGSFAAVDAWFLTANSLKVFAGGYIPLAIGIIMFVVMHTWRWGKGHVRRTFMGHSSMTMSSLRAIKLDTQLYSSSNLLVLTMHNPTSESEPVPPLVEMFIKKFKIMPRHLIILTVVQTKRPYENNKGRLDVTTFQNDPEQDASLISIKARFGFMEEPNVEKIIDIIASRQDLTPDDTMEDWIVYVGRERIVVPKTSNAHLFRKMRARLYALMVRNSSPSYDYYGLGKDNRLSVELVPVRLR